MSKICWYLFDMSISLVMIRWYIWKNWMFYLGNHRWSCFKEFQLESIFFPWLELCNDELLFLVFCLVIIWNIKIYSKLICVVLWFLNWLLKNIWIVFMSKSTHDWISMIKLYRNYINKYLLIIFKFVCKLFFSFCFKNICGCNIIVIYISQKIRVMKFVTL